ncbi:unnamed protein product [Rodentolepis nana]|uniref:EGF-like domain-containing protein n=1 Tax=Rodentolepis nana TaxID=102285 RepID=A0A0R3TEN5_RODNA|nr:unnamed protein product [Rodentolepis nana]
MGSGDLRPLFNELYEEQVKDSDKVGKGNLTISRKILVRMHTFLDLFMKPRETDLWKNVEEECHSDYSDPQFVRFTWSLALKALRTVNTRKDWNEMNPYFSPNKSVDKTKVMSSAIDWDNTLFLDTPKHLIRNHHALMVFNLVLCEKPELQHVHLCPDGCFGRLNTKEKWWELGNPCERANNTNTDRCFPKPEHWPEVLRRLWKQLENPYERFDNDHISGAFSWLTRSQGYQCDCKEGFQWNNDERVCEKSRQTLKKCDPITLAPCSLPGTQACTLKDYTKEADCLCHEQYTGTFCERFKDPCTDIKFNLTFHDGRKLIDVTGEELCQVNMDGKANEKENVEVRRQKDEWKGTVVTEVLTVPRHSRCVGKPGTDTYYCLCKPPFSEDLTLELPNCLHQEGSCDTKLCVHGTCVTTPNHRGKALCMCYAGYVGTECDQREEEWSVWSSCKPVCGRFRTRTRTRSIPSHERGGTPMEIQQVRKISLQIDSKYVLPVGTYMHKLFKSACEDTLEGSRIRK